MSKLTLEEQASLTASPISPEMMEKALDSAHDTCKDGCIHNDPLDAVNDKAQALVAALAMRELREGRDPIFGIFFFGLHVGYRLGMLMHEPTPTSKVN